MTRIIGTLHKDQYTVMIISLSFLGILRNVSDKFLEKNKTHILQSVTVSKNRADYETMCKNIVEPRRPQITIWHMRLVCWIPKATNTLRILNTD
jgi:hypothetical protein